MKRRNNSVAIRGFKHGGLKRFYYNTDASKLPHQHIKRIGHILEALDLVNPLDELAAPTYRLHPLKGDRKGVWSVRVTANRRITFRLRGSDAYDVDFTDYHGK